MIETYTSTGKKILRHLDELMMFQETGMIDAISLQIAPTSRCNLNCVFCSNANRKKHEDLLLTDLMEFMRGMRVYDAKTIEWTGGGDPTQYEFILPAINEAHRLGYKQGMITNGIALKENIGNLVNYFSWLRVSLNSLDYVDDIQLPDFKGVLGFSYVMNKNTTGKIFDKIRAFVVAHPPKYIRIVPDCQITGVALAEKNLHYSAMVKELGPPYFYQTKTFSQPKRCWWGHFKPFLLHDGYIYPCSSVVLNDTSERSFHKKFRWMTMAEFLNRRESEAVPYDCKDCTNCVFGEQNELIEAAINPDMECFI